MKDFFAVLFLGISLSAFATEELALSSKITKEISGTKTTFSAVIAGSRIIKATLLKKEGHEEAVSCISHDADRPFADERDESVVIYRELERRYNNQNMHTNMHPIL